MTPSFFEHLLSDEHRMIRDAARDFAQKEIAPIAAEFDESGEFPYDTIKKMGAMGFMGIEVSEQYGGAGMDTLAYALALEAVIAEPIIGGVLVHCRADAPAEQIELDDFAAAIDQLRDAMTVSAG